MGRAGTQTWVGRAGRSSNFSRRILRPGGFRAGTLRAQCPHQHDQNPSGRIHRLCGYRGKRHQMAQTLAPGSIVAAEMKRSMSQSMYASVSDQTPGRYINATGRAALLATGLCPVLALYGFGVAFPPIAAALAQDPHAVLLSQLIGGIVALACAVSAPAVGRLIDRFGYRTGVLVPRSG